MFWLFMSFYFSLASVKYVQASDKLDWRFYIDVCYNEASRHLDTSGKFKHKSIKNLCFGKKVKIKTLKRNILYFGTVKFIQAFKRHPFYLRLH